jgi:hypothetical protein
MTTELPIVIEEELYPWQSDFLGIGAEGVVYDLPPFNFAKCGTKAGKTAGCALGMFIRMLNRPGTRYCWTAPVNKQIEPTWNRYFRPLIQSIPKSYLRVKDSYGMWSVEVKHTGSAILLKSGDEPWNLRGDAFHGAVIDEAAHYPLESYFSILTNLTDNAGTMWAISTPKAFRYKVGQSWFDSGFAEGLRQERSGLTGEARTHRSFRVPTWSNPKPEIQKWVRMIKAMAESGTLPGGLTHFRREYGAEDVEGDSAVFRFIDKLHTGQPEAAAKPNAPYVMGWDPAATQDASVISVWDSHAKKEVWLEIMLRVPIDSQYERVTALYKRYNKPMGQVDATSMGGDLIMNDLRKRNLPLRPVKFNNANKAQYVQMLAQACEREEPRFLNDPIAKAEMEAFGYEILQSGVIRYCAPEGQRDDTVTARMLAWNEIATGGVQVF